MAPTTNRLSLRSTRSSFSSLRRGALWRRLWASPSGLEPNGAWAGFGSAMFTDIHIGESAHEPNNRLQRIALDAAAEPQRSAAEIARVAKLTAVTNSAPTCGRQTRRFAMKIVVIGGSGLIGKKLVNNLRQHRHEVVAASPSSGVNTLTREGLAEALAGAQVVVDVANSPSFEDKAVLEFFETAGRNLLA